MGVGLLLCSHSIASPMRSISLSACLAISLCVPLGVANADQADLQTEAVAKLIGTVYTTPHRETVEGALSACGMEFGALERDYATKKGAPVFLVGSLYVRQFKAELGYALKLSVRDGVDRKVAPFAPYSAYVRAPQGNAARTLARSLSDTPGAALWIGSLDKDFVKVFQSIVDSSRMVVGFNRASKQMDVQAEIDLSVVDMRTGDDGWPERIRSPKTVSDFMSCIDDLFKAVESTAK